jgi:hypothetical protein
MLILGTSIMTMCYQAYLGRSVIKGVALVILDWWSFSSNSYEVQFQRDHTRVRPIMQWIAISAFCWFLTVDSFTDVGILLGLIDFYIYVVLYSLYDKLREENKADPIQGV